MCSTRPIRTAGPESLHPHVCGPHVALEVGDQLNSCCSRYGADPRYRYSWRAWKGLAPSIAVSTSSRRGCSSIFSGVTTDQRVVAKQEIQETESAKRAGAPYAHHRNQAKTQTQSCGRNFRMRPERDDTETKGSLELKSSAINQ